MRNKPRELYDLRKCRTFVYICEWSITVDEIFRVLESSLETYSSVCYLVLCFFIAHKCMLYQIWFVPNTLRYRNYYKRRDSVPHLAQTWAWRANFALFCFLIAVTYLDRCWFLKLFQSYLISYDNFQRIFDSLLYNWSLRISNWTPQIPSNIAYSDLIFSTSFRSYPSFLKIYFSSIWSKIKLEVFSIYSLRLYWAFPFPSLHRRVSPLLDLLFKKYLGVFDELFSRFFKFDLK